MVRMAGDSVGPEGDDHVRIDVTDDVADLGDQRVGGRSGDTAIGDPEEANIVDADAGHGGLEFAPSLRCALPSRAGIIGGEAGLAVGDRDDRDVAAVGGRPGHQSGGEIGLVVRVRPDAEEASGAVAGKPNHREIDRVADPAIEAASGMAPVGDLASGRDRRRSEGGTSVGCRQHR